MIIIYLVYLLHTIRLLTKHSKLMLFVLIYFDCEASNFVNQILGNDGKVHSSMKKHMLLDYTCLYIVHTSTWMIDTCLYIVHTSTWMIDTCLYIVHTYTWMIDTCLYIVYTYTWMIDTCLYIVHTSTCMIDTCLYIVHTYTWMIDTCLYISSPRHSILMETCTVIVVLRIVNFPFYIKSCAFAKNMHITD